MITPIEIVENVREALESRNYKKFAECFHEDGIYERPYALKGTVHQYEGIDKIYNYIATGMAAANELFEIISVEVELQPCAEHNVIFAEFFLSGKSTKTTETFRIASSAALIFCNGDKIVKYRDFPNSAGIAQAAGTLPQYTESLSLIKVN